MINLALRKTHSEYPLSPLNNSPDFHQSSEVIIRASDSSNTGTPLRTGYASLSFAQMSSFCRDLCCSGPLHIGQTRITWSFFFILFSVLQLRVTIEMVTAVMVTTVIIVSPVVIEGSLTYLPGLSPASYQVKVNDDISPHLSQS